MHILVAEDQTGMAQVLKKGLEEEGYAVRIASDGPSALASAASMQFDMILLDVMLPGCSGIDVARRLRVAQCHTPILMLTARDTVPDIVLGLDAGADDYLTKPFSFAVLLARIRALERRHSESQAHLLRVADVVLDVAERRVLRNNREVQLTPTEFRLLEFLMRHSQQVVSRHAILEAVWGPQEEVEENTLDAFIRLLRRKLNEGDEIKLIHTVRGIGYSLQSEFLSESKS